ncbi:MAG: tRNA lysidine(34) synthetase TilS [Phycisphaerae bacterium]|nr:tRNA lysidine(34) synthetase TilS [Phycisphaerae bacterium]
MRRHTLVVELRNAIERHALCAPDELLVVGVSGGADSMALLHGLFRLRTEGGQAPALHVAHLNHGIRGEDADTDEQFVRQQAEALRLPCTTQRMDVPAWAAQTGTSIEEAARSARYAFLERVCRAADASAVAVGHHADDQAETLLHRLLRGTALRGLAGMRPSRLLSADSTIRLVRPLLALRRGQILDFLHGEHIAYRHDCTNDGTQTTRNRIRHELLPLAEAIVNPQAVDALSRLAEQAAGLDAYLRETAERMLETLIVHAGDGEIVLDAGELVRKRTILQTEVVRQAVLQLIPQEGPLTYHHLAAAAELAGQSDSGKSIDLPGRLRITKSYGKLVIALGQDEPDAAVMEASVSVPGRTDLPECGLEIETSIEPIGDRSIAERLAHKPPDEEWLDWGTVAPPLCVRPCRPGDRFQPLGMATEKRIAGFLLDEKIPKAERGRIVILCDRKGPLWLIPLRIDQRARITERTKQVLRIRHVRP